MTLTIAEALLEGSKQLRVAGVSESRREAASLLAGVLGKDLTFLITRAELLLSDEEIAKFRRQLVRRGGGEPLQYISGVREFFGLEFEVDPGVLIPRPETESLVETALSLIPNAGAAPLICDMGTGTGCIAISLLHERPRARALAVDISPAAARVAARNAAQHQVGERMNLVIADCFAAFQAGRCFDMIVANPPYISDGDWEGLQREVRDHEPRLALTSGPDGLNMIGRLIREAPDFLLRDGYLLMEIGYEQRAAVERMIDPLVWTLVAIHNDLQGIPRTVVLRKVQGNQEQSGN